MASSICIPRTTWRGATEPPVAGKSAGTLIHGQTAGSTCRAATAMPGTLSGAPPPSTARWTPWAGRARSRIALPGMAAKGSSGHELRCGTVARRRTEQLQRRRAPSGPMRKTCSIRTMTAACIPAQGASKRCGSNPSGRSIPGKSGTTLHIRRSLALPTTPTRPSCFATACRAPAAAPWAKAPPLRRYPSGPWTTRRGCIKPGTLPTRAWTTPASWASPTGRTPGRTRGRRTSECPLPIPTPGTGEQSPATRAAYLARAKTPRPYLTAAPHPSAAL
mmetsp:Transcript_42496/g.108785  ORF Transcript_42496/g.108785 Transcript_42496/m.108785 type:complete len:276 (+) Transcript_42496:551-1378(+)